MSPSGTSHTRLRAPVLAALIGLVGAGPTAHAGPQGAPDDARVRQAWSYLSPAEQEDAAGNLRAEAEQVDSFQNRILRFVRAGEEGDPGLLPEAPETEFFDPHVHAPRQPIARVRLAADDARAIALRESLFARRVQSALPSAWRYDWGRREVQRTADFQSAQHVFDDALAGFAPGVDFARALVERALDDGRGQKVLAAFERAYTDRAGNVYPGVTLYDAWSSGEEIEMPDVDVLGLLATITGKPPRWKAPVPDTQHDAMYAAVEEAFAAARTYRGLRAALAETFFVGTAPLPDNYAPHLLRLHGLWEEYESDPARLRVELSKLKDPGDFLLKWARRFDKDKQRNTKAGTRQATLDWDARQMRALLVRILEEHGAFERNALPASKPKAPEAKPPQDGR